MLTLGEIQNSAHDPSLLTCPSEQQTPFKSTWLFAHLQIPASLLGLVEGQESLHSPLRLTSPSLQQISSSFTWPNPHPQTPFKSTWLFAHLQIPALLLGLVEGQESLHSPLKLTSPSLQQISSNFTWPNPHPQIPLTLIGLAGEHVSLQIPLSLTWPSEQQMPPI